MDKWRQPCIVGVGRFTQFPAPLEECATPVGMLVEAAHRAAIDATTCRSAAAAVSLSKKSASSFGSSGLLRDIVAVGTPGMFTESRWRVAFGKRDRMYKNFPYSVACALKAKPDAKLLWRSFPGGNGPQFLVNSFAELIALGKIPQGPILIGGVEENATFDRTVRAGRKEDLKTAGWGDQGIDSKEPPHEPVTVNKRGILPEDELDVYRQVNFHAGVATVEYYAHFENAFGHALGRTRKEHTDAIAELFSRFSIVAASQPHHSWYPRERSANSLKTLSKDNRMMAMPYYKWMIARDEIDQSAALIMMSWGEAERRRIPKENIVFLHGSGDSFDSPCLPLRRRYDISLPMEAAYREAFRSAGLGEVADHNKVDFFDMYSCYPVAVEAACAAVGIRDPLSVPVTRLTATGGLPYHGGPGSNYSCHGIAAVCEKLRLYRFRGKLACVGANGGNLTEHSVGIYGTSPPARNYHRRDYLEYAPDSYFLMDNLALSPNGEGIIISWTLRFQRKPNIPLCGVVIGEMKSGSDKGKRFLARTMPGDTSTVDWLMSTEPIGQRVLVKCDGLRHKSRSKMASSRGIFHVWFSKLKEKSRI